jgi:hypothetical protein
MATTPNLSIPLVAGTDTAKLNDLLNAQATALDTNVQAKLDEIVADTGDWVQVTSFLNGYTAAVPVYYRIHDGRVDLSGQLWKATAPAGETAFQLPASAYPRNSLTISTTMFANGTQPTWIGCTNAGVVNVWSQAVRTNGVGFQLDGVGWGL